MIELIIAFIIWLIITEVLYWKYFAQAAGLYAGKIISMELSLIIVMVISGIIYLFTNYTTILIGIIAGIIFILVFVFGNVKLYEKVNK